MSSESKIGAIRLWALAAGGMVGGGIYIALGVVISVAGQWAWLSFLISGVIAIITAYSYSLLSNKYESSGGAFEFLERIDRKSFAGSLSWLLIFGYTLTISVYAFAFGHYLAYAFRGGDMMIRCFVALAGGGLTLLNLRGLGKMTALEVVIVTGNLLALIILGVIGIFHWAPIELTAGAAPRPAYSALAGAAAIFVSYEGFQLLTYEYSQIKSPQKIFTKTLVSSAIFVVFIYILVALGAPMLTGALTIVEEKQIALSIAAEEIAPTWGLVIMTVAASFATAAAINSTLFSTGKLAQRIASDGELPKWFDHKNSHDVPSRGIIVVGTIATVLALLGSLSTLAEAASLIFLVTFSVVNWVAAKKTDGPKWLFYLAIGLSSLVGLILICRLIVVSWEALLGIVIISGLIFLGRPKLLESFEVEGGDND